MQFVIKKRLELKFGVKLISKVWPVKTLSDSTVTNISFTPKRKTLHWLVNQAPPAKKPKLIRVNGLEWINFRVKAVLVGYKKSPDDNDFHVVIKDLNTKETMIVEFKTPFVPGCVPLTILKT